MLPLCLSGFTPSAAYATEMTQRQFRVCQLLSNNFNTFLKVYIAVPLLKCLGGRMQHIPMSLSVSCLPLCQTPDKKKKSINAKNSTLV